jgi:hypothetical protein
MVHVITETGQNESIVGFRSAQRNPLTSPARLDGKCLTDIALARSANLSINCLSRKSLSDCSSQFKGRVTREEGTFCQVQEIALCHEKGSNKLNEYYTKYQLVLPPPLSPIQSSSI